MEDYRIKEKKYRKPILVASVLIPLAVAALMNPKLKIEADFHFLPSIYATINAITSVVLLSALAAVKTGRIVLHRWLMSAALILSSLFLVLYVLYHLSANSTPYKGDYPGVYYSMLISHIILSAGIVPMVLFTFLKGWSGNVTGHKKLARITFPLWLYVAISGVVVYLMIAPYYPK